MNTPYLESSEQLDRLFPAFFHKIRFHMFQNISKFPIHGLRLFKYKNMFELCDNIKDFENRGEIMVKRCFVLQTCSSSRCHIRSHSLVCIENNLFIVGIGPISDKDI